ncbi:1830_t:CDS:2, partial [Ambispora leptoticha]
EKDNRERHNRDRSPSLYGKHRSEIRNHSREKDNKERHNRDRSPSLYGKHRSEIRNHSREKDNKERHNRDRSPSLNGRHRSENRSHNHLERSRKRHHDREDTNKEAAQKRLKQMMDDAKKLSEERTIRVAELKRAEDEEERRVKEHMAKLKQEGGHSEHLRKLYKQAISSPQALDLGGQVRKSRSMLQRNIGDE